MILKKTGKQLMLLPVILGLLLLLGCKATPVEPETEPTTPPPVTTLPPETRPPTEPTTEPTDPPPPTTEPPTLRDHIAELQQDNPDAVGYIRIEGTAIDYPVVQGTDNAYYLKHDFYGADSKHGAIFWDAALEGGILTQHVVIHGHNMTDGLMFGDLEKFKDREFWKDRPLIELETLYYDTKWEVIAVYLMDGSEQFPLAFRDGAHLVEYAEASMARAVFPNEGTVEEDDILMLLNTCSYEWKGAHTMICAKLVEKN